MPPTALTAFSPRVPCAPVPDRMMQMAFSCWSSARERKKRSIDVCKPVRSTGPVSRRTPPEIVMYLLGGRIWTRLASTAMPCVASTTGMRVCRESNSTIKLSCLGSRCGTSTKAMPLSDGTAPKNFLKASSPPADAPMPTTGIPARSGLLAVRSGSGRWRRYNGAALAGVAILVAEARILASFLSQPWSQLVSIGPGMGSVGLSAFVAECGRLNIDAHPSKSASGNPRSQVKTSPDCTVQASAE